MQPTNSLKKSPTNISLFSMSVTDEIFKDPRFVQLMNLLIKDKNLTDYTYCIYCDNSFLRTSLFVPIFHTIYLSCSNNNVIIGNDKDLWILEIFPNNNYYILNNTEDTFDYSSYKIQKIDTIKEIPGVI